jgi:hypothetical protein
MESSFSLYAKNRILQRETPWIFPPQITVAGKGEERREMPPGGRKFESRPGYQIYSVLPPIIHRDMRIQVEIKKMKKMKNTLIRVSSTYLAYASRSIRGSRPADPLWA